MGSLLAFLSLYCSVLLDADPALGVLGKRPSCRSGPISHNVAEQPRPNSPRRERREVADSPVSKGLRSRAAVFPSGPTTSSSVGVLDGASRRVRAADSSARRVSLGLPPSLCQTAQREQPGRWLSFRPRVESIR